MDNCTKFVQPESETSLCTSCLCVCLLLCTTTAIVFFALFMYKTKQFNQQMQTTEKTNEPRVEKKDCAEICAATRECKGYVYDSTAKTCLLKME